jgi:ribosome-binding factor A
MTFRKVTRKDLQSACAEPGPDDGLDPRLDPPKESKKVPNRKALQLCGQVARTLAGVFAECGDDVLRELVVESVVPAPNASRLLVTVYLGPGAEEVATPTVEERLAHARGRLRSEVARAIHRRRAPDLTFRVADR